MTLNATDRPSPARTLRRVLLALGSLGAIAGIYAATAPVTSLPCAGEEACSAKTSAAPADEGLTGQPRLVEFTSAHCPACTRMAPIVAELERRCARSVEGAIVRVSMDEPDGEALAMRYQVQALPTFLGLDAAGAEVTRLVGVQSPEKLSTALGAIRAGCPTL